MMPRLLECEFSAVSDPGPPDQPTFAWSFLGWTLQMRIDRRRLVVREYPPSHRLRPGRHNRSAAIPANPTPLHAPDQPRCHAPLSQSYS
jgi:hypothetical protein